MVVYKGNKNFIFAVDNAISTFFLCNEVVAFVDVFCIAVFKWKHNLILPWVERRYMSPFIEIKIVEIKHTLIVVERRDNAVSLQIEKLLPLCGFYFQNILKHFLGDGFVLGRKNDLVVKVDNSVLILLAYDEAFGGFYFSVFDFFKGFFIVGFDTYLSFLVNQAP